MPKSTVSPEIYEAGRTAQRAGKPRSSCPYTKAASKASYERREWLRGYDEEKKGATGSAEVGILELPPIA